MHRWRRSARPLGRFVFVKTSPPHGGSPTIRKGNTLHALSPRPNKLRNYKSHYFALVLFLQYSFINHFLPSSPPSLPSPPSLLHQESKTLKAPQRTPPSIPAPNDTSASPAPPPKTRHYAHTSNSTTSPPLPSLPPPLPPPLLLRPLYARLPPPAVVPLVLLSSGAYLNTRAWRHRI